MQRHRLPLALVGLAALAIVYLGVARGAPGLLELPSWCLGDLHPRLAYILEQIRAPRLLVAAAGGASLALAGAIMQATFRNPLASPDLVGTAAGAALGGALAIVWKLDGALLAVPAASLLGAMAVTALVFVLAGAHGRFSATGLLLAGVALNTLVGALTSFAVTFTFDNYTASSRVLFWLMGGLDSSKWENVAITGGGLLLFGGLALRRRRELDLLTLRDDSAFSLGVDGPRARRWLLLLACGLTATTVANTGGIAFVGLVVPHLTRLLVGPSHRALLPLSAVFGAMLLVLADLICRLVPPDTNLRLG
ncbi:MAG: iron ABC transporter permease, partial [Planctomycetes bacterium]|nr:iron ABC transporter permease [Planctomycetota bacterium]